MEMRSQDVWHGADGNGDDATQLQIALMNRAWEVLGS